MNSIEVKNLTKSFSDFTLKDLSFNVPSGTIMGLVGENGAGKSTAIKLIMNTLKADNGEVSVLGASNLSKEFTNLKQDIGVVLDEAYFPEVLNAKNINNIMKLIYKNWDENTYFEYIKKFSLPLTKIFKDFSRGMKMKLSIAVALSHNPKLLILDEATSGLDPMVRDEILDVFNEFTRDENHSIILSSHIISDLEKICDYICFIHKGEVLLVEEKDLLLEKYAVIKLTENQLETLPKDSIVRKTRTNFGYEVLVQKNKINSAFRVENTRLEDIILLMVKEGA
ncbi:ABC transporter ATP-binding protein [Aerococcus urinaeequi]|uniref:ABC transporter ATP-binding protein n=1 Tax=Aerococcus urinaeequi TaxID=51665 RepID=A0AA47G8H9_9LACT|nr:ABC transporter ATP-binding protein [Aerococcus urinaeequi]WAT24241.1 ABC transporter ATP-binding protein [Aerococcus urinaeequi]